MAGYYAGYDDDEEEVWGEGPDEEEGYEPDWDDEDEEWDEENDDWNEGEEWDEENDDWNEGEDDFDLDPDDEEE